MSVDSAEKLSVDGATAASLFVINLCASTSPMALTHPNTPELKRFTFFVSRQREDGRERFRLHMGYFGSQDEAESLLIKVRDVYPAAWAGPAPTSGMPKRRNIAEPPVVKSAAVDAIAPAPAPAPAAAAAPVASKVAAPALESMSNVRDVLAQLETRAEDRVAPAPAATAAVPMPPPVQPPPAQREPRPVRAQPAAVASRAELNAAQTLKVLEAAPAAESEVRVVTPEDTQTLTDIRLDAQNNAPPCFAVQLIWSVTPLDVATLPHLAIFDAYTLYNVEGNRQGRRWYGLRLGFFSDPNSATQVAHYVRADYPAVAVVPVATKERDRARGGVVAPVTPRLGEVIAPLKPESEVNIDRQSMDGFELLQDDRPRAPKRDVEDIARPAAAPVRKVPLARERIAAAVNVKAASADAKPAGKPGGKRVVVRKQPLPSRVVKAAPGAPTPLESTLEILGASTLTLDESREIINDSAVRKPVAKKVTGNRFSKLLTRLSRS